eukprot:7955438-Pyramimonas_sp.AAC.1
MECSQMWPHQLLLTVGAMRAKKDNGDRIIGLLPEIARLWSMCREGTVREWNQECTAPWDLVQVPQGHGLLDISQF